MIADPSAAELDQRTRTMALNPAQSFIIQAPAGSGKTELLTQRYLSLLSRACEHPEEIIAITFTRKAAAQMRDRVINALQLAEDPTPPIADHRLTTWQLAREVLNKDQLYQWQILANPQRLRILTIDSLCGQLSNRLPLLAGYGAPARIIEDATPYYQQAVRELITHSTPVELLAHLDNNATQLTQLCVELLAKREQWLPYIIHATPLPQLREQMEQGLAQLAEETLATADRHFSPSLREELCDLLSFAGHNLLTAKSSHPLTDWANRRHFPTCSAAELNAWRGLARALLTEAGEWRKRVDIRNGFPPKTAEKPIFENMLAKLSGNDTLKGHLQQIIDCPPVHYTDAQWRIIIALIEVLPLLVAQLQLIFQQQGIMDFIEMGLSASRALGEEQHPTDLALSLDYRIRHLLIDEFQDTSVAQFKLLEKLLLGWEPGDGRSLFLVGDPMQSIYRFRNAEVGLFLRTVHHGIQNIQLTPLYLAVNFRSGTQLISWFNQIFPLVLPTEDNLTHGAISYKPAFATQPQIILPAVSTYACADDLMEGQKIVDIIRQYRQQNPDEKMAVLVRSRSHLQTLVSILHAAKIKFQAIEIEPLTERSEIQDLAALTRGLYHRADRIAWLAILRAPYCGLTLTDIYHIAEHSQHNTIYETLLNCSQLAGLSEDAQQRLRRIVPVLSQTIQNRGRLPVAEWIEGAWLKLGGPAGLTHPEELINAQTYFKLLTQLTQECPYLNWQSLNDRLNKLYAAPNANADPNLQIMTIHKAKGLEFDHVILPELQRKPASDSSKLFLWTERANAQQGIDLMLAPIKEASTDNDPMYDYLKKIEQQKLMFESGRLLYVAATRAKHSLHLLAVLPNVPEIKAWQPPPGSFLHKLWPYFREQLPANFPEAPSSLAADENPDRLNFRRVTADWQLPDLLCGREFSPKSALLPLFSAPRVLLVENKHAAWIGTVIHEALAHLAQQLPHFPERRLRQLGMPPHAITEAMVTINQALQNILQDPRGQWILSNEHQESKNEFSLTAVVDGKIEQVILDRTFVDISGVRWIIDYKTGDAHSEELNTYRMQLNHYAKILSLQEPRPIRLGLYFPLSCEWQEWSYELSS